MKGPKEPTMYCQLCNGLLRKGTLASHMSCMIVLFKMVNNDEKSHK